MSSRGKRVLVYTISLLTAPLPLMPYVPGTREFALALIPCGAVLSLSSLYVLRGEMKLKAHSLLGYKLLATSLITFIFGVSLLIGAIVYLIRRRA